MSFKIVSWNVNSLKVRMPHLIEWVSENEPTVIALQETKVQDHEFPLDHLKSMGFHCAFAGQKSYNGVAILSREKIDDVKVTDFPTFTDPARRLLAVTINGVRVVNLYVPNGQRVNSQKYEYKMEWLSHLQHFLKSEALSHPKLVVLGDFNIAPEDLDVHDPKVWAGDIMCSQAERDGFKGILEAGLIDCFRGIHPEEQCFSWWDYRLNAFKRNLGLRIDHILASEALFSDCRHCYIDTMPRALERPSDHAPVVCEF